MTSRTTKLGVIVAGAILVAAACLASPVSRASETALPNQAQSVAGRGRFPHENKEHRKIECASCHLGAKEKPKNTDQPMAKDFPHATCVKCHNFAAEFFKAVFGKPSGYCTVCHEARRISKADKALIAGSLARGEQSDFGDVFSHKGHRKTLPSDLHITPVSSGARAGYGSQFQAGSVARCTDCHAQVMRAPRNAMDMKTEKAHASCFVCHAGNPPEPRRVPAAEFPYENDCAGCHALRAGEGGMLRAASIAGMIKDFRHNDHDLDIRPKKRSDFPLPTARDYMCVDCHAPAGDSERLGDIRLPGAGYCDRCHIDNRPGLPAALAADVRGKLTAR